MAATKFTSDIYKDKYRETGIVEAESFLQTDISMAERTIDPAMAATTEFKDAFLQGHGGTMPDMSGVDDIWKTQVYLSPRQNRYWNKNMKKK